MLIAFGIEQYDAAIVEVEGGSHALIADHRGPLLWISPDTLNDDDRLLAGLGQQLGPQRLVFYLDARHFHNVYLAFKHGLPTSCLPVALIGVGEHCLRLSPVGEPEVEASQFLGQPVVIAKLLIGIIGPVLIDYAAYEVEVGGRLNAESLTVGNTAQPYEPASELRHASLLT